MKAILEFNLPEDKDAYFTANKASAYESFIWDLDQNLRSILKHGHSIKSVEELAEKIRDDIAELSIYDC